LNSLSLRLVDGSPAPSKPAFVKEVIGGIHLPLSSMNLGDRLFLAERPVSLDRILGIDRSLFLGILEHLCTELGSDHMEVLSMLLDRFLDRLNSEVLSRFLLDEEALKVIMSANTTRLLWIECEYDIFSEVCERIESYLIDLVDGCEDHTALDDIRCIIERHLNSLYYTLNDLETLIISSI